MVVDEKLCCGEDVFSGTTELFRSVTIICFIESMASRYDLLQSNVYSPKAKEVLKDTEVGTTCLERRALTQMCPSSCHSCKNPLQMPVDGAVQSKDFELGKSNVAGMGLFLREGKTCSKDSILLQYTGDVVTLGELTSQVKSNQMCYTVDLKPLDDASEMLIIDGRLRGSMARLVNHSDHPNCKLEQFTFNGKPVVFLVANEDMTGPRELTFQYAKHVTFKKARKSNLCSEEGCRLAAYKKKLCRRHSGSVCSTKGCNSQPEHSGKCGKHLKHPCLVDGCTTDGRERHGLCHAHRTVSKRCTFNRCKKFLASAHDKCIAHRK